MSAGVVAGRTYTFNVLFLDGFGVPSSPVDATIEIFYFRNDLKNLIFQGPLVATPEPGRFIKSVLLPEDLMTGEIVYGIMRGSDPVTARPMTVEDEISIISPIKTGAL
jgi:hypothetical protein